MSDTGAACSDKPIVQMYEAYLWPYSDTQQALVGNVVGHPRFPTGKLISTSIVLWKQDDIAETENTIYQIMSWAYNGKFNGEQSTTTGTS